MSKKIFEDINATPRIYTLANVLVRTIDSLNVTISNRNELITEYKKIGNTDQEYLVKFYFGLPNKLGHVDQRFRDCVEGISTLTDDVIFFSSLLCSDLADHAEEIRSNLKEPILKVTRLNFDSAKENGLLPGPDNYQDWENMFRNSSDDSGLQKHTSGRHLA